MALSDDLSKSIGARTKKGTKITEKLVSDVRGDEDTVLEVVEDNTELVQSLIGNAVIRALEEIGVEAERFAKQACPVDTGRLRNSITHYVSDGETAVYIGTNVPYAKAVEFGVAGTKYKGANDGRGYLRPAAQDHTSYYRSIMEAELEKG